MKKILALITFLLFAFKDTPKERSYSVQAPLPYWRYQMNNLDTIKDAILFSTIDPETRKKLVIKISNLQSDISASINYQQHIMDSIDNIKKKP